MTPDTVTNPVDEPSPPSAAPRVATDPSPWPALSVAAATLAAVGASLAIFVFLATLPGADEQQLLGENVFTTGDRRKLLFAIAAGVFLPLLAVGATLLRRRRALSNAIPGVLRAADLLSPLVVAFAVPPLFSFRLWHDNPLPYLCMLSATVVGLERLLRRALPAAPIAFTRAIDRVGDLVGGRLESRSRHVPLVIVTAAATAYAVFAAHYTLLTHHRVATAAFDLGIYDNLMFNALHRRLFRATVAVGPGGPNFLSNHAEFAMLLLLPAYAIRPGAEMLLVFQACILGFAAVPLYMFAATQIPRASAVLVALAYLFYAPLHGPQFYDFHWLPIAVFFHFWLYFAIATRRRWLTVASIALLFLIREDVSVGLAVLGVFLWVTGARPRLGLALTATSVVWFVVVKFVVMPAAGEWWFADIYSGLIPRGDHGYGGVVKTILTNPTFFFKSLLTEAKLTYALHILAPLVFLPLRRGALALLAIPGFFFTLMTTGYPHTLSIAFQYTTHWVPYVFGASVLALMLFRHGTLGVVRRRAAVGAMTLGVASHSFVFGAILQHEVFVGGFQAIKFEATPTETSRYRDLLAVAAMIPREASVAATENEVPHVSTRETVYTLRYHHGDADYLLVNSSHIGDGEKKVLEDAFTRNRYGLLARRDPVTLLFKKGHTSPETERTLAEIGITAKPK